MDAVDRKRGVDAIDPVNYEEEEPRPLLAVSVLLNRGAVAGGGIGGDQAIDQNAINQQVEAIEAIQLAEIRALIQAANDRRAAREAAAGRVRDLQDRQSAVFDDIRCLLPEQLGLQARNRKGIKGALMPLVDTFYDAFRPFLTEAYDDDATFRECFGIPVPAEPNSPLTADQQSLRRGFELLMKESIVQNINEPAAAARAFTQLLFNNDPLRMVVSATGSIVAMILARDALCLFSSTVISFITFGTLTLPQLTNLCGFVYYNCTLVNLQNLLIYFNVPIENAQAFIQAVRYFNREQRQYIIMSFFLFGLNAIAQPNIVGDIGAYINNIIQGAQRYFAGAPADPAGNDNNAAGLAQPPADQAAAAAALNAAAVAAAAAAGEAAADPIAPEPVPVPVPGQAPPDNQVTIEFMSNTLRYGWMRGLRITTSCLRDVFHIYLQRLPAGQGHAFNLVNFTGRMARWGVAAIQDRSAVLDPAKPTQEVIRLLAAVNGLNDAAVRTLSQCEAALYEFGRKLKGIQVGPNNNQTAGAVSILQPGFDDTTLVYLTEAGVLLALRDHFCQRGAVVVERLQNACLGMRLFVFEQGMRSNILAAALVEQVNAGDQVHDFNDTPGADQASESVHRMARFILEDNDDTVTKNLFGRVRLMLQAFSNIQAQQLQQIGVVISRVLPGEAPGVSAAQIFNRQRQAARLPHKEHMKSAVRASIIESELGEEQKQSIIERLMESIDMMDFDAIQNYVLNQNPNPDVLERLIGTCQELIRSAQANAQANVAADAAEVRAAAAALYSGLGRCAASLMNVAVGCSGAVGTVAQASIERVRGFFGRVFGQEAVQAGAAAVAAVAAPAAAAAAAAVPGAAILANIDLAQQIPVVEQVDEEINDPPPRSAAGNAAVSGSESEGDHGGGRSRSRKRSASKRTRRKGKQPSKKLKRKSRRYVRRASSRKGRK